MGGPGQRPVFRRRHTHQRQGLHQGRALHGRGHRARARCGACRGRQVGQDAAGRARQPAAEDRRPDRSQSRAARLRRNRGQRQADPRDAQRRHSADGRSLPLLRGLRASAGRRHQRNRREHGRLPPARTAGCRGPDHSVEFPDPDGRVETGPGDRRGQLRGPETRGIHAHQHPGPGEPDRRYRAARRAQHRQRLRSRSRHAARSRASASARSPSRAPPRPAA